MKWVFFIFFGLLLFAPNLNQPASAQDDTCAALATRIITETLEACQNLPHDQACHSDVEGLPGEPDSFIPLESIQSLTSPALDVDAGTYGVSLLNTSATLPRMVGEQGVIYLLLGDAVLENRVLPESAFIPADPIPVTTTSGANIRTRPSTNDSILASVNWNTELMADGLSEDSEWLRVSIEGNPGWIYRPLVSGEGLDNLPVINPDSRAVMQDFTLQTGRDTNCDGGLNLLVIQGLDLQPVTLRVNRAEIRFRGTITLRSQTRLFQDFYEDPLWFRDFEPLVYDSAPAMDALCRFTEISAVDGDVFMNDGLFSIPRGYRAFAFDCDMESDEPLLWNRSMPITPDQIQALLVLENLPEHTLHYVVDMPTPQETARVTAQIASASRTQNTSAPPSSDSSPAQLPTECPGFMPTSPVDSIQFGYVRFYWDPAIGADRYQVNLYNYADQLVISFATQGPETTVRVDTMSPLFSMHDNRTPPMSYEIVAFQGGNVMCVTPRLHLLRDYDPDPDCPQDQWFSGTCEDVISNAP